MIDKRILYVGGSVVIVFIGYAAVSYALSNAPPESNASLPVASPPTGNPIVTDRNGVPHVLNPQPTGVLGFVGSIFGKVADKAQSLLGIQKVARNATVDGAGRNVYIDSNKSAYELAHPSTATTDRT